MLTLYPEILLCLLWGLTKMMGQPRAHSKAHWPWSVHKRPEGGLGQAHYWRTTQVGSLVRTIRNPSGVELRESPGQEWTALYSLWNPLTLCVIDPCCIPMGSPHVIFRDKEKGIRRQGQGHPVRKCVCGKIAFKHCFWFIACGRGFMRLSDSRVGLQEISHGSRTRLSVDKWPSCWEIGGVDLCAEWLEAGEASGPSPRLSLTHRPWDVDVEQGVGYDQWARTTECGPGALAQVVRSPWATHIPLKDVALRLWVSVLRFKKSEMSLLPFLSQSHDWNKNNKLLPCILCPPSCHTLSLSPPEMAGLAWCHPCQFSPFIPWLPFTWLLPGLAAPGWDWTWQWASTHQQSFLSSQGVFGHWSHLCLP